MGHIAHHRIVNTLHMYAALVGGHKVPFNAVAVSYGLDARSLCVALRRAVHNRTVVFAPDAFVAVIDRCGVSDQRPTRQIKAVIDIFGRPAVDDGRTLALRFDSIIAIIPGCAVFNFSAGIHFYTFTGIIVCYASDEGNGVTSVDTIVSVIIHRAVDHGTAAMYIEAMLMVAP